MSRTKSVKKSALNHEIHCILFSPMFPTYGALYTMQYNATPSSLHIKAFFLGLLLHPSPPQTPFVTLGGLALGAPLNDHCCERRYIN